MVGAQGHTSKEFSAHDRTVLVELVGGNVLKFLLVISQASVVRHDAGALKDLPSLLMSMSALLVQQMTKAKRCRIIVGSMISINNCCIDDNHCRGGQSDHYPLSVDNFFFNK